MALANETASAAAAFSNNYEIGGRSIFWALITLALNAMFQPSFCGHLWSGDTFQTTLWPHRSSPIICLTDAVADIYIMFRRFRRPSKPKPAKTYSRPMSVAIRLGLFVLSAPPQAIKLFSCSGILATQLAAGAFLFSTVVSMLRTLRLEDPDEELVDLKEDLGEREETIKSYVGAFNWLLHLILSILLWHSVTYDIPEYRTVKNPNASQWVRFLSTLILGGYLPAFRIGQIIHGRDLGKQTITTAGVPFFAIQYLNNEAKNEKRSLFWCYCLVIHMTTLSYLVASMLETVGRMLLPKSAKRKGSGRAGQTPSGSAVAVAAVGSRTAHADPTPGSSDANSSRGTDQADIGVSNSAIPAARPRSSSAPDVLSVAPLSRDTPASGPSSSIGPKAASDSHATSSESVKTPEKEAEEPWHADMWIYHIIYYPLVFLAGGAIHTREPIVQVKIPIKRAEEGLRNRAAKAESTPSSDVAPTDQQRDLPEAVLQTDPPTATDHQSETSDTPPTTVSREPTQPNDTVASPTSTGADVAQGSPELEEKSPAPMPQTPLARVYYFFMPPAENRELFDAKKDFEKHLLPHWKDRVWLAFGLLNFATVATYYLRYYDGTGTYAPAWTSILG